MIKTPITGSLYNSDGVKLTSGRLIIQPSTFVINEDDLVLPVKAYYDIPGTGNISLELAPSNGVPYVVELDPDPDDETTPLKLKSGYFRDTWDVPDATTYQAAVMRSQPLGYWRLGEAVGANQVLDYSGHDFHSGAVGAGLTFGMGGVVEGNAAAAYSGADTAYVRINHHPGLKPTAGVTVEGWIYQADWATFTKIGRLISTTETGGWGVALNEVAGRIHWYVFRGGSFNSYTIPQWTSMGSLSPGWHYFAFTYDGVWARIYVDGADMASVQNAGGVSAPIAYSYLTHVFLGGESAGTSPVPQSGTTLQGGLDECAVYGRALTATEVTAHYIAGQTYASVVLQDGPVGYWRLGEASGTQVVDSSGNGRHGTYSGAYTLGETGCLLGDKAVYFTGTTGIATVPTHDSLNFGTGSFTLEYWVHFPTGAINPKWSIGKGQPYAVPPTVAPPGWAVAHWTTSDPVAPAIYFGDGAIEGSLYFQSGNIYRGQWAHTVWVVDRAAQLCYRYLNGVAIGTPGNISALGSVSNTQALTIGEAGGSYFTGWLDEVALYPRALSAAEAAAHYAARLLPAATIDIAAL